MKTWPALLAALACAAVPPAASAQATVVGLPVPGGAGVAMPQAGAPQDPQFDLDFSGGGPAQLVDALAAASGHPVNVIIPEDVGNVSLPPMKLRGVTVPGVFEAVTQASRRTVQRLVPTPGFPGGSGLQNFQVSYGFRPAGRPAHDGIWIYFAELPPEPAPAITTRAPEPQVDPVTGQLLGRPATASAPPEEVRVLNLSPFLQVGRSVEDITTAIRTACELLPGGGQPKLTFHKETNLLLSRGRPDQLELIEQVLMQIRESAPPGTAIAPFKMSPELMRRYGLMPADKPAPAPAAEETPRVP